MSADMDVLGIATAYRRLVLLFVAHLLWSAGWVPVQQLADDSLAWGLTQFAVLAVNIAILFLLAYNGYRMASWLGSEVPWLWGGVLMVPWLGLIALLALCSKAARACRDHGVPVGLLGPKLPAEDWSAHGPRLMARPDSR